MGTSQTDRTGTPTTGAFSLTCQAYAGSLVAPCPNSARTTVTVRGQQRAVCPAHA